MIGSPTARDMFGDGTAKTPAELTESPGAWASERRSPRTPPSAQIARPFPARGVEAVIELLLSLGDAEGGVVERDHARPGGGVPNTLVELLDEGMDSRRTPQARTQPRSHAT